MVNLTLKDLFQEPIKVILIILGIAASLLMVHISYGMINGTLEESTRSIDTTDYDAYITQKNRPNIMMGGRVSDQIFEEIASSEAVKDVDRIIDDWIGIEYDGEGNGVGIYGIDLDNTDLEPWDVIEGDIEDIKKGNNIIVDKLVLKYYPDLKVGDKIIGGVFEEKLEIVGFCENAQRTGNPVIWTNFEAAKGLCYLGNESTYLAVKFNDGYSIEDLEDLMEKYEDEVKIYTREEMKENINDFILNDMGMASSIGILAGIGFMVAMIVLSITLYQSVSQKIEELVTIKALGASKRNINGMLIGQTFLLVTLSYIISVIIAILIAPALTTVSTLSIRVNPFVAIMNYFIALGLGIFCSIFSIRKVHKTDPAIIFRG